jgi:type IV secretory pathway ATPase VirB11/archaellum biosynthesis ATPase
MPPRLQTQVLVTALRERLYGAGSLEALLRDESIEEIDINGAHDVFVDHVNGVRARVAPVGLTAEVQRHGVLVQLHRGDRGHGGVGLGAAA